jgi:hypothetical protein
MTEYIVSFMDGSEDVRNVEGKIVLEPFGVRVIGATRDRIIPWHQIKEVQQLPGSD